MYWLHENVYFDSIEQATYLVPPRLGSGAARQLGRAVLMSSPSKEMDSALIRFTPGFDIPGLRMEVRAATEAAFAEEILDLCDFFGARL